ncbi:MAG: aryl-sulfate sulfotransferase, partial [Cyclobacteriaceae bacterium]
MKAWEAKSPEEAAEAGRDPDFIPKAGLWPDKLVEVRQTDKYHGEIVWEWHIWDHLIQNRDPALANYGDPSQHPELLDINASKHMPDLLSADSMKVLHKLKRARRNETVENRGSDVYHLNAVNYNPDLDQLIFSSPQLNEIFIIDHSTTTEEAAGHSGGRWGKGGDFLYRWGNPENYGKGDSTARKLFHQHDVRWIEPGKPGAGNITVFNNDMDAFGDWDTDSDRWGYSSVYEIKPPVDDGGNYIVGDDKFGPLNPDWKYMAPDSVSFYSSFISGAHRMENGN